MAYDDFVSLAKKQDPRNTFHQFENDLSFIPVPLRSFYTSNNPANVEIVLHDLTSVRFCPAENLKQLQNEYALEHLAFIFATHEGDPIYYKPDGIYVSSHSSSNKSENKISKCFIVYIERLITEILSSH